MLRSWTISLKRDPHELRRRRAAGSVVPTVRSSPGRRAGISASAIATVDQGSERSREAATSGTATGAEGATVGASATTGEELGAAATTSADVDDTAEVAWSAAFSAPSGRLATSTGLLREAVVNGIWITTRATAAAAVAGTAQRRLRTNAGRKRAQPCGRFISAASCFWRRPRSNSAQNSGAGRSARLKRRRSSSVGRGVGGCGAEPMFNVSTGLADRLGVGSWRSGDGSGRCLRSTPSLRRSLRG